MIKKHFGFASFQILFFSMMWTSKTAHVLFFEQSHSMGHFGASYSAMALAGYFSFLIGYLSDLLGFRKTLTLGGFFYSSGLLMRIYPESLSLSITSGILAGMGASCVLSALRLWILSFASEENTATLVGLKSSTSSLGAGLGCFIAGVVPTFFKDKVSLQSLLIGSSAGVLLLTLVFWVLSSPRGGVHPQKKRGLPLMEGLASLFQSKYLFFMTVLLGTTTGFYVSFISPYLPIIMKDKGFSLLAIGVSTGVFSMLRFFVDPYISRYVERTKDKSLRTYLIAELVIILITTCLFWSLSKWIFVILLVLRSTLLGFSAISEEVLWIRSFPKERIGILFGLCQSGFFLGDFMGGIINGYLYQKFGLDKCIFIVLLIMLINAGLFLSFFRKKKNEVSLPLACTNMI